MRRFFNTGLLLLLTISMGARSTNEEAKPALTNEPTKPVVQLVNIFADAGGAEAQYGDSPVAEQAINVLDNDATTKFLTFNASSWVQLKSYEYYTVSKYTLTSADDAPERDPKNWTLKGSMDGETWVVLDEQSNQSFSGRGQTKTYSFENKKEFRHYRMDMTNHSGEILQVADILLFGVKSEKVLPIAQFKVNRSKVLLGEVVQIENLSKNAAGFEWHFGDEKSSTEKAPEHQYAKGGVYDITLIASGNGVTDTEIIKDVFVMDTETCWSEFVYPHVKYSIKVDKNHEGIKLIEAATDNKVEEYMRAQTIVVADLIYKCPQEAPQFTEFIFEISEETPIAALGKVPVWYYHLYES